MAGSVRRAASSSGVEATVERRRAPRAPVVIRVSYSTVDALFSEFAQNVNEGGLFIETETPPPPDTRVSLHFELPGSDRPFRTEGRVAWCRPPGQDEGPPGMGVEFDELSAADRARINDLVRRLRAHPDASKPQS
jgi:type IV pilus assembly protein PilZ